jgi:hypothetical protein
MSSAHSRILTFAKHAQPAQNKVVHLPQHILEVTLANLAGG